MHFLKKPCQGCNKPMNGGVYRASHICPHCGFEHEGGKSRRATVSNIKKTQDTASIKELYEVAELQPADVKLVSKEVDEGSISAKLGSLSVEVSVPLVLKPDMFKGGKFIGMKSAEIQECMKRGKKEALKQMRQKAAMQGANVVSQITTKNSMKAVDAKTGKILVKVSGIALVTDSALEKEGV